MKRQLSISILLLVAIFTLSSSAASDSQCKKQIAQQLINGKLLSDSVRYSGKYLNELGDQQQCQTSSNQTYYLQILKVLSDKYVIGTCIVNECSPDQVRQFDTILLLTNSMDGITTSQNISYQNPVEQYKQAQQSYLPGFYVMIALLLTTLLLCALGMVVQYTDVGNITDKSRNIQVQFQIENTDGRVQYIELLAQADKILLNRKKIWAIFFLCFSLSRNTMILFYDTQKAGKVGFIRVLKVLGFIWISFDITVFVAFKTFPVNYNDYLNLSTNPFSVMMISGIIFGFSIVYFHSGFQVMYDRLLTQYLKKQPMNVLLFILRNYLFFVLPLIYITAIMVTIMPFMGDGPIYFEAINDIFLNNCVSYWWTNILLINNFYPWAFNDLCGNHLTYISNQFQMIAIIIPFFVFVYRHAYRKILATTFLVVGLGASLVPVIYMTLKYDVNAYPGFQSSGDDYMFFRLYYRIPPYLFGIAFAIFHFEYKYVDKLNDGSKPFHKDFIDRVKDKVSFKLTCYIAGGVLIVIPILVLMADTACVSTSQSYCWGSLGSSIYNTTAQMVFFAGLVLILVPCAINQSDVLRPLMSSHLWHVMEELTYSAFLLQFIVVVWFFASRSQNTLITISYIFQVTLSSCIISYILGIPFYLLIERPFKNFLDLILFPKSSIFKKKKDLDDEDSSSTDEDEDKEFFDTQQNLTTTMIGKDTMITGTMITTDTKAIEQQQARKKRTNHKSKCRFCQDDDECSCECMITKKACDCVRKVVIRERFSRNFKKEDVKNMFAESTKTLNKNSEMDKKKVSFDFFR